MSIRPAGSRCPCLDGFAHALGVQFAMVEKFEYLVCRKSIFTHREDHFPVGGLRWEIYCHPCRRSFWTALTRSSVRSV
jgi:hypothetical protein